MVIRGRVRDIATSANIAYATVYISSTSYGTTTDDEGRFELEYKPRSSNNDTIVVCYVGYKDFSQPIKKSVRDLKIDLEPTSYNIGAIEVKATRNRYRRRNNPAAELASKLIKQRDKSNYIHKGEWTNYEQYEKIVFSNSNVNIHDQEHANLSDKKKKRADFRNKYIDTSRLDGKTPIVPLTIKEQITRISHNPSSQTQKEMIHKRGDGIDSFISQDNILSYLNTALTGINIFEGDIYFMQRHFTGPLSKVAPAYYKYYLRDTITIDSAKYVKLEFIPFNQQALGFIGHMLVSVDSTHFIKEIELDVPSHINLNFVRNMRIRQQFVPGKDGRHLLVSDEAIIQTPALINGSSIQARRYLSNTDYTFEPIKSYSSEELELLNLPLTDYQWSQVRHIPITQSEAKIPEMVAELRSNKIYRISEKLLQILVDGYIETGKNSKFDIGPVLSFIGGNDLEGTRIAFGGYTTAKLMPRVFLDGHIAYGTRDKQFKYNAGIEYSFNKRNHYPSEFPRHSIRLDAGYDVDKLGQLTDKDSKATIMTWLERIKDSALIYRRQAQVSYIHEFKNHLSYTIAARHYTLFETSLMHFSHTPWYPDLGFGTGHGRFSISELEAQIRWSPGEELYQTKNQRFRIKKEAPVFSLSHRTSIKDVLGSDFTSNHTEFFFTKRFGIAPLGYIEAVVKAGAQWSAVPYIMLPSPSVNMSYVISEGAFALMNPLEFIWDKYCMIDITYFLDGLIFNHIPLIKRTGMRELITFRMGYGHLSNKNNPMHNSTLPALPIGSKIMTGPPYMELGVGIENILKIFRVDYVHRLNYIESGLAKQGVLVTARIKF